MTGLPSDAIGVCAYRRRIAAALCCLGLASAVGDAWGHAFAQPYLLPVPFTYYAYGAMAALAASFLVIGLFARGSHGAAWRRTGDEPGEEAAAADESWPCALTGLSLLVLCIATGLAGTRNAYANFNMTFFWIVFVLGVPYAVAIFGDFYRLFSPWRAAVSLLELLRGRPLQGVVARPERLGSAVAVLFYMAFIWLELFGQLGPRGLAVALLVYTAANVVGAILLGKSYWFRHCELFAVLLGLLGLMSLRPKGWHARQPLRAGWTWPLVGLLRARLHGSSIVVFILFMLSSTAFDGLHSTLPWVQLFFGYVFNAFEGMLPGTTRQRYAIGVSVFAWWQWTFLVLSPFLYLALLRVAVMASRWFAKTTNSTNELVSAFAPSLIPIAFVYHVTHYYTLLLSQGLQLWKLVSDPFGLGWNLFGTATADVQPIMIGAAAIWMSQVCLIVAGHVLGVYVAHVEATRIYAGRRHALASQIPMLALMMFLTAAGLWILSLPLS